MSRRTTYTRPEGVVSVGRLELGQRFLHNYSFSASNSHGPDTCYVRFALCEVTGRSGDFTRITQIKRSDGGKLVTSWMLPRMVAGRLA